MRIAIDLDGPIAQHGDAKDWWNPDNWPDLVPTEGAFDGMWALQDDGHQLHIVTARQEHENTYIWLAEQFFTWPITHVRHKWEVPSHIYLDDSLMQLEGLAARRCTTVKWATRMNSGARANWTVETWPEFVALIRSGKVKGKLRRRPRVRR